LQAYDGRGQSLRLTLKKKVSGSIPDKIVDFILASASMPLLFPPVEIHEHKFIDGGVRNVAPLSSAFKAARLSRSRSKEIVVVSTTPDELPPGESKELDSGREVLARGLEIMVHEIVTNDINLAQERNRIAPHSRDYIKVDIRWVRPPYTLSLGALDFHKLKKREAARQLGWKAMQQEFEGVEDIA
jgi:NTE family protein